MKQQSKSSFKLSAEKRYKTKLLPLNQLRKTQIKLNSYMIIKDNLLLDNKNVLFHQQKCHNLLKSEYSYKNPQVYKSIRLSSIFSFDQQKKLAACPQNELHGLYSQVKRGFSERQPKRQMEKSMGLFPKYQTKRTIDLQSIRRSKKLKQNKSQKKYQVCKRKNKLVFMNKSQIFSKKDQDYRISRKNNAFDLSNDRSIYKIKNTTLHTLQTLQFFDIDIQKDLILVKKSQISKNNETDQFYTQMAMLKKKQFPKIRNQKYTPWQIKNPRGINFEDELEQCF